MIKWSNALLGAQPALCLDALDARKGTIWKEASVNFAQEPGMIAKPVVLLDALIVTWASM
jgi:hypothetical protein